jgi:uncharacterized protein YyaL (SSP411 family)
MRALLCLVVLFACATPHLVATTVASAPSSEPSDIEWRDWDADVFALARQEDRLVLVDVGIEGCTACRWMHEDTYRHSDVVRRVHEHFVAVAVDANVRPDLGARFERWGWPATVVLTPDGRSILAIRGNKRPRSFVPILDRLIDAHRRHDYTDLRPTEAPSAVVEDACVELTTSLDTARRREGWGPILMIADAPMRHAWLRAHGRGELERREHALRTAEAWATLIDPVWGGVFVGGHGTPRTPIFEKRLLHEAAALVAFAHAYALTGDAVWSDRVAEVHRFVEAFLLAPDGLFYATQEDVPPGFPDREVASYWARDDAGRRALGVPPVDHGVYADLVGRAIEAYAETFELTRQPRYLETARRAAEALHLEFLIRGGYLRQAAALREHDTRLRPHARNDQLYLAPQASAALAYFALHRTTGDDRWAERATSLLAAAEPLFDGTLYRGSLDRHATTPPRENAWIARALWTAGSLAHDERLIERARSLARTLAHASGGEQLGPQAEIAVAVETITLGAVEVSVVGRRDDGGARALFEWASAAYEPRKLLHYEPNGRYPADDAAIAHVCTSEACSSAIHDPTRLVEVLAREGRAAPQPVCGTDGGP